VPDLVVDKINAEPLGFKGLQIPVWEFVSVPKQTRQVTSHVLYCEGYLIIVLSGTKHCAMRSLYFHMKN
jgi:hypothetical protein